ncbi:MAG: hypothetical protein WCL70_07845 [Paludibacter sp.]
MKKLLIIGLLAVLFTACQKTFNLDITNGSSDTYSLYVNDVYQQDVNGKEKVVYSIPEGYWSVRVVQKTGFFLIATDQTYSGTCAAGENKYIVFPQ